MTRAIPSTSSALFRVSVVTAFVSLASPALADDGSNPSGSEDGQVDVLVVPFTSSGIAADESRALAAATSRVFVKMGRSAELAGVGTAEILTLSGCEASDDDCLATIPETMDTQTVVFGTGRVNEGAASVVLIVVDKDTGKHRHSIVLIGATREARLARYEVDLQQALSPPCVGSGCAKGELAADPSTESEVAGRNATVDEPIEPMRTASQSGASWDASRVGPTPWIVGGAGLGAIAVGAGFLVWGNSKQSQVDDANTDSVEDLERLEDLEGQAKTLFTVGDVLVVGGLAATLVAAGLAFHSGRQGDDKSDNGLSVGPMILPNGGGLVVSIGGWQ